MFSLSDCRPGAIINMIDQVHSSSISTAQRALLSISMFSINNFSGQNNLYLQKVCLPQTLGNHKQGIGADVPLCTRASGQDC